MITRKSYLYDDLLILLPRSRKKKSYLCDNLIIFITRNLKRTQLKGWLAFVILQQGNSTYTTGTESLPTEIGTNKWMRNRIKKILNMQMKTYDFIHPQKKSEHIYREIQLIHSWSNFVFLQYTWSLYYPAFYSSSSFCI